MPPNPAVAMMPTVADDGYALIVERAHLAETVAQRQIIQAQVEALLARDTRLGRLEDAQRQKIAILEGGDGPDEDGGSD